MSLAFITVFFISFLITLNAVPRFMQLAFRTGFLDHPGPRKIHATPIPYGGGLGVALGTLFPIIAGSMVAYIYVHVQKFELPGEIAVHIPGVVRELPRIGLLVGASLVILFLGLADDRKKLSVRTKLLVQTLVALGMAIGYDHFSLFLPGTFAGKIIGITVTVFWIVGITNAFNLLDHMDGLSAGVAAVAGTCFLGIAVYTQQWFIAALLASLMGGCIAFLAFNLPPAKVFLGDAGSLFIGFILASLTITFTFFDQRYELYSYAVPLVVLSVPLFDTVSVVLLRLQQRRSPFDADTNHFAHRLVALGLSRRAAVFTIYILTLITGFSAIFLYQVGPTGALLIVGQIVLIFVFITILEMHGRKTGHE